MKNTLVRIFLAVWAVLFGWCCPLAADEAQDLTESAASADSFLREIDQGRYGESWDMASNTFKLTIRRDEWIKAEDKLRKPLGQLVSRKMIEQRPAKDPKNLPKGDYMVIYYKSSFSGRPDASELVTLVKSDDGRWRVLTYHAS